MITNTAALNPSPIAEKIEEYDRLIFQLKEKIREQTEKKKELARQERQIEKLVEAAAKLTEKCNVETIDYIWERLEAVLPPRKTEITKESISDNKKCARWSDRIGSPVRNKICQTSGTLKSLYLSESIAIVQLEENVIAQWPISELELDTENLTPIPEEVEEKAEELVKNPAKKNTSNSFFVWQLTSNPAISTYFNLKTGKTQAAYFAANNKQRLKEVETKLMQWFEGISSSIRVAQRMNQYKYELKVVGWNRVKRFDDSDFGWLSGIYDLDSPVNEKVFTRLCCLLTDKPEPDELEF